MWITLSITALLCFSQTLAGGRPSPNLVRDLEGSSRTSRVTEKPDVSSSDCEDAIHNCRQLGVPWTGCFEDTIGTCIVPKTRSHRPPFIRLRVNSSSEAEESPSPRHQVHIPSSALQKSRGSASEDEVLLVTTLLDSIYFELSPLRSGRSLIPRPLRIDGSVMGGEVLVVRAGNVPVRDLSQPIRLTFTHNKTLQNGTCVFWYELQDGHHAGTGYWSPDGCVTTDTGDEFICSCNHLSFFAVLVNPELTVDQKNVVYLSYISYVGSALSVFFLTCCLIIYIRLQQRRPEKAVSIHMQLTVALLCLHLSFLLSCFWVWQLDEEQDDWVCQSLGFFLHWSLLATFTWMTLEGFHLYLLLVRVFNIYVRRYVLKLSVVGWGFPTLIAVVCGISRVYGKFSLKLTDVNSTAPICLISSDHSQERVVRYITTVAFPSLVLLWNSCMLALVVYRLCSLRRSHEGGVGWEKVNSENRSRLWKDSATVLGLSWVLGLPWAFASSTFVSLTGIYVFTILNSLQGVFMFLWSLALSCKSRSDTSSSSRDPSSQKMMTTSFNNGT
ncbi:adhesion G-protein coupled receptor G1-like [Halichoeres trimaculatus]|uniref:adhesion G-protein coupled receptor G1-like n=1 Tax=Halichoeres trimaculatus TaxID=147232 RepID=UPI003D9F5FA1